MTIKTLTDARFIQHLNKVTYGTPQWLELQLRYKPVQTVFELIQDYWENTPTTDGFPWEAHPARKMRARMQTLIEDTMLWYSDRPDVVSKCKQLKIMQAIIGPLQEN